MPPPYYCVINKAYGPPAHISSVVPCRQIATNASEITYEEYAEAKGIPLAPKPDSIFEEPKTAPVEQNNTPTYAAVGVIILILIMIFKGGRSS